MFFDHNHSCAIAYISQPCMSRARRVVGWCSCGRRPNPCYPLLRSPRSALQHHNRGPTAQTQGANSCNCWTCRNKRNLINNNAECHCTYAMQRLRRDGVRFGSCSHYLCIGVWFAVRALHVLTCHALTCLGLQRPSKFPSSRVCGTSRQPCVSTAFVAFRAA